MKEEKKTRSAFIPPSSFLLQPSLPAPVAQRRRHLLDVEASAGSSPAGGTACGVDWRGSSTVS